MFDFRLFGKPSEKLTRYDRASLTTIPFGAALLISRILLTCDISTVDTSLAGQLTPNTFLQATLEVL